MKTKETEIQLCKVKNHFNSEHEVFNSTENKGKSAIYCKTCGKIVAIIFPLDNENMFDECEKKLLGGEDEN